MKLKKQWRKEQNEFCKSWEFRRKIGFKKYFTSKSINLTSILLGMHILGIIIKKDRNFECGYIVTIISVSIILAIGSWLINEFRYTKLTQKNKHGKS